MSFLFFLLMLVGWAYLYSRLRRAEDRLDQDQYERGGDSEIIAELTRRVYALEKSQPVRRPRARGTQVCGTDAGACARIGRPRAPLRARAAATNLARSTPRIHG